MKYSVFGHWCAYYQISLMLHTYLHICNKNLMLIKRSQARQHQRVRTFKYSQCMLGFGMLLFLLSLYHTTYFHLFSRFFNIVLSKFCTYVTVLQLHHLFPMLCSICHIKVKYMVLLIICLYSVC